MSDDDEKQSPAGGAHAMHQAVSYEEALQHSLELRRKAREREKAEGWDQRPKGRVRRFGRAR